ncbi:sigma-54-dependent Fis family transcriptional regulator [Millisia brevis]|uniref:sigma-54-dependent Fis family transcriptional regulator n=1 Tax=Millisia brevis TaxID=264148 RepID=UPI00082E5461|nr:helix-turn-helix domain-containing protein [Millisia brevis]
MPITSLTRARERFLVDRHLDETVRDTISASWRRSIDFNVPTERLALPFVREPNPDSPLIAAAEPVLRQLAEGLTDEPVGVILTSADGVVLDRITANRQLIATLDRVYLAPGYSYSEEFAGTNGIGTALETRRPTLISGSEHYSECLGRLACAGVPIVHPMSGKVVGALDLTGWIAEGGALLATLARTAGTQIEGRLLAQAGASQTALMNAYMRACRRFPQSGILALGDDLVLMNQRLPRTLDARDQAALLELGHDCRRRPSSTSLVATLPSGRTARLSHVTDEFADTFEGVALLHVHVVDHTVAAADPPGVGIRTPAGTSSSWRRCCDRIAQSVRMGHWVAVSGESGVGRTHALDHAARHHLNATVRVFDATDLAGAAGLEALAAELDEENFAVVLRDIDMLDETRQSAIAELIQGREQDGWLGVTLGAGDHEAPARRLILPFFEHTVAVPPLRHRIEDLQVLVPLLLRQLGRGGEPIMSPEAMRRLSTYSWPGNVEQLRQILRDVLRQQRSGIIEVERLPPECRALTRYTLSRIEALERDAIVRCLAENGGDKNAAAASLGISRATIYRKIRKFGIDA